MALDVIGNIEYSNTFESTETPSQAHPPVCTRCKQTITRENFGKVYRMWQGRTRQWLEVVECRQCTGMIEGEIPAEIFFQRHNL